MSKVTNTVLRDKKENIVVGFIFSSFVSLIGFVLYKIVKFLSDNPIKFEKYELPVFELTTEMIVSSLEKAIILFGVPLFILSMISFFYVVGFLVRRKIDFFDKINFKKKKYYKESWLSKKTQRKK